MSKSLQDLWGMLNSMQIIITLNLINVVYPGNAHMAMQLISELCQKDMYPTDLIYP